MSELEISLDIMEQESSDEDVNWRVQTKIDKDTHNALLEFANKFTQGNISGAARYMIRHHIEEHGGIYMSSVQRAWLELRIQQKKASSKLTRIRAVHQAAIELRKHPDAEYEAAAGVLAESLGVSWPIPENELPKESVVMDDLRFTLSHLESLWTDNGDVATLRDLQRKTRKYTGEQLREHLNTLENEDRIRLAYGNRGSVTISPVS